MDSRIAGFFNWLEGYGESAPSLFAPSSELVEFRERAKQLKKIRLECSKKVYSRLNGRSEFHEWRRGEIPSKGSIAEIRFENADLTWKKCMEISKIHAALD